MDDSTPPNGLELELEAEASPVMSESLSVVVNSGLGSQGCGRTSNSSIDMVTTVSNSNGGSSGPSAPMLGVTNVTDFLNSVVKPDGAGLATSQGVYRFGRRVGEVHRHFSYCVRESKEYGMCIYCGHTLQRNTTRQKHHLSTHCPNAPIEVKARYDQERNSIHTRPAIEFQRKRNVDLVPGSVSNSLFTGDLETSAPISPMDPPVKMERLDDRLEASQVSSLKHEKNFFRVAELDDEVEASLAVSLASQVSQGGHYHSSNTSARRDIELSNAAESRFRKPFKVWDNSRRIKKGIVVSSLRELLIRGSAKLGLVYTDSTRAVLEEDGTEIDDEEYLEYLPDNTTILLLRQGDDWKPPSPYDDPMVRVRQMRIRNQQERREF